ncbi:MAG: hypothetical protein Q8P99_03035 [bacterium]|nr:hypothetical protein [bacterium]
MNNKRIGAWAIIFALSAGAFFLALSYSPNRDMVGNDKDEHGCIGSAGYSWCEIKNKCLKQWEEQCEPENTTGENTQIACTQEAKLCPDGSYVGRAGPNCEFTTCPNVYGILPYNSGVRGVVTLGPTCPVERIPPDPNCADKPYKTTIKIFHVNNLNSAFLSVDSDEDGVFFASLPPGEYILDAGEGNNSGPPTCGRSQVTVAPDSFTPITISCDTGIR